MARSLTRSLSSIGARYGSSYAEQPTFHCVSLLKASVRRSEELAAVTEPLVIAIAHKLGKEDAVRRIKPALGNAAASFPILTVDEEIW
jgi:hypothetical protein